MDDSRRNVFAAAMGMAVVAVVSILVATPLSTMAGPTFSDWSEPVNLGPVVNSSGFEGDPALSKSGRSLYFLSSRPGFGGFDIWVSQRPQGEEEWGVPVNLGPVVNSTSFELSPNLSRDGHWLFFTSVNRPGGHGGRDIWISYRQDVHDDLAWQTPINAGPGVNSLRDESDASFFENDDAGAPQLFFSRSSDIYVSGLLPDGTFGPAMPVSEINSTAIELGISVRFDGLEAFFFSNRSGNFDSWTVTRQAVFDPWSAAANLGPLVNSAATDGAPEIASDRETLYFNSNRPGGIGAMDLYKTTRTKLKEE